MGEVHSDEYAKRFLEENIWNNPLRLHNKETKKCKYLTKDGKHCNKKREGTTCYTCYTCCFNCTFPEGYCNKGECIFLVKVNS